MEPSSLQTRVERLLAAAAVDAKTLSVLAGLSTSHVGQLLRGEVQTLRTKTAEALSNVTGASCAWIAFGEGDEPSDQVVHDAVERARATSTEIVRPSHPAVA